MKRTYYLFNPGRLSRRDNTLKFTPVDLEGRDGTPKYLPVENIDHLYVFGSLDTNSSLFNFLGKQNITIHYFDYYENYTGSFMPKAQLLAGKMIVAQVKHYQELKLRIEIAHDFIEGASFNMLKNLKYYQNRGKDLKTLINLIEKFRTTIPATKTIPELMGLEGNIRMCYYEAFDTIVNDFEMAGRTKQPPQNELNALISYANMMCYAECLRAISQTQLNPTISYLHEPGERRYSLALDIAEIFKPILVDRVIFKVLNKREISEKDFDKQTKGVFIKDSGKKKFISTWENRLAETIQHRTLNKSVSYKYLIRLECYKLSKHILGMGKYKPFKIWW